MPIYLDREASSDEEEFVDVDEEEESSDGHEWSPFELRILYSLLLKGLHKVSLDPKKSKNRHRYMTISTELNKAINNDDLSKDIPVKSVAAMVKNIMKSNKGGMAYLDGASKYSGRMTRRVMQRFSRNFDFDGSIEEWNEWRKEANAAKVKPAYDKNVKPVEEKRVERDAYGRVMDEYGRVADSSWITIVSRRVKKKKRKRVGSDTRKTRRAVVELNDNDTNEEGYRDGSVIATVEADDPFGPLNSGQNGVTNNQVIPAFNAPIAPFAPMTPMAPALNQINTASNAWSQNNAVPEAWSQINTALQPTAITSDPVKHNIQDNYPSTSFGNNRLSTWNSVSSAVAFAVDNSSFGGTGVPNFTSSTTNTVWEEDKSATAAENRGGVASFALPTPRFHGILGNGGGGGTSFAPPTPRLRELAHVSLNDGLSPFGVANSWPEIGQSASDNIQSTNTDLAEANELATASVAPVFDPLTSNWASHIASTEDSIMDDALVDKYEPDSNLENSARSMPMGMPQAFTRSDHLHTSYSSFDANHLARLEEHSPYPHSPYSLTQTGRTHPARYNYAQRGSGTHTHRDHGINADPLSFNRFERPSQASRATSYAPPRSSMLNSAPIYSVERPWITDNFKENIDPATSNASGRTHTNAEIREGDGIIEDEHGRNLGGDY